MLNKKKKKRLKMTTKTIVSYNFSFANSAKTLNVDIALYLKCWNSSQIQLLWKCQPNIVGSYGCKIMSPAQSWAPWKGEKSRQHHCWPISESGALLLSYALQNQNRYCWNNWNYISFKTNDKGKAHTEYFTYLKR